VHNYFKFLKNVYFFKELSDDEIKIIQNVCHEKEYSAKAVIFKEKSKADKFYIILDGAVEVWQDYDKDYRDLLAVHKKGKLFGEMSLIDDLPRSATLVAKKAIKLLYINRDDFHRIITENSSIALSIMRSVSLMVRMSNKTFVEGLRQRNEELEKAYKELKATQEELLKTERLSALGKFSSLILHDIRNPLSILRGYAEMIILRNEDRKKVVKSAENIIHEADRLNGMANELLDFSRGDIRLNMSIVDLKQFVASVLNSIRDRFVLRGIKLRSKIYYTGPVLLDRERMFRVFINLADNARKAMPMGGDFSILIQKKNSMLSFDISDTGVGIPDDLKEKIFEPFFSLSKEGGTGLGMAIVKSIVEAHEGHIYVVSSKGHGTTFHIEVPIIS